MQSRAVRLSVQIGFILVLALTWHLLTQARAVSPLLLPPFGQVMSEFGNILRTGDFVDDLKLTLYELFVAFSLAATLGCALGYVISRSRFAVRVFDPLLSGIYSIPSILLFPLYVLIFGLGPNSKIAIGATIAFFPIILNAIAGLSRVDAAYITAARSMGASDWRLFWSVMLPAAFPVIITGLRMGLILSFLSILGAETIASLGGLGHRIVVFADAMDMSKMFAYTLLVICIAMILNILVTWLESRSQRHYA